MKANLEKAQSYFQQADITNPSDACLQKALHILTTPNTIEINLDVLGLRWQVYYMSRNYPAALLDLTAYLSIDTSSRNMYYNRGIVNQKLNQVQAAKKDFTETIHLAKKADDEDLIDACELHLLELDQL